MKLARVEIKNFRSIKAATIDFDPTCRVLVGINESGKSNVLKAMRLLSKAYPVSKIKDVRERVGREAAITEAYVRFVFSLEKEDTDEIFEVVEEDVLSLNSDPEIVVTASGNLSLSEACQVRNEALYRVDVMGEARGARYFPLATGYKIAPGWKKPSPACPTDYKVDLNGDEVDLKSYKLVLASDFPDIPAEYLLPVAIADLAQIIGTATIGVVNDELPETIFWEYREDDLLPNSVDVTAFAADPDLCPPLKNMFVLAGIAEEDIKASLEEAMTGTPNQIQNYLDHIAEQTTAHFQRVWEEYKDISFSLRNNANSIIPGIKETNTHDFEKRSDGFKRFVTFLLMISVEVETDQLDNTLLLIDEPEMSLHPSGARYLRNELIRISTKNRVVYTTHSIFMIDSANIGRHYIVKKKGEVTTLARAEESNIAEEEVLLNALGYSAFEVLREKNLIFEGWNDKHLFEIAVSGASTTLKRKYEPIGVCHVQGVSAMKTITPIIEIGKRECIIISDGDAAAIAQQKSYRAAKGFGTWFTYQDVDATITAITGEDFVKKDHVVSSVNAALAAGGTMPAFTDADLPTDNNKLAAISAWLRTNGMTEDQAKLAITSIKNQIFETLAPANIETEYTKLLAGIVL